MYMELLRRIGVKYQNKKGDYLPYLCPLLWDARKLKGRWVGGGGGGGGGRGTEFLHLGLQIMSEAEAKK